MLSQLFGAAALAKVGFALTIVAGAYAVGTSDLELDRPLTAPVHVEKTHEPSSETPAPTTKPERVTTPRPATTDRELFATATPKPASTPKPMSSVKPTTSLKPTTSASFEALLKECVARYARAASNTKEACDRALAASGMDAKAFWAKYRTLMIPPTRPTPTATPKATVTAKPVTVPTLSAECMAKYETLKTLKSGPADVFEAALRAFNAACRPTASGK